MQERLVIFIDSVHPILEQRLTQAGFICERHFKTTFEELYMNNYFNLLILYNI